MIGDILYHELKGKLTVSKKKYRRLGNKSVEVAVDEDGKEHELDGTEIPYSEYELKDKKKQKESETIDKVISKMEAFKGDPGADADEDYIIEAVIPRVLEQIRQPKDGKDGADADTELIIKEMLPLVMREIPRQRALDESLIIQKVLARIKIPQDGKPGEKGKDGSPDTPVQVKDKLESLKGDERLDASAIKNLPKIHIGGGSSYTGQAKVDTSDTPGVLEDKILAGANITITKGTNADGTKKLTIAGSAGGSGNPGGSDTEIQYNDGGAFGGIPTLTYDKVGDSLLCAASGSASVYGGTSAALGIGSDDTRIEFTGSTVDFYVDTDNSFNLVEYNAGKKAIVSVASIASTDKTFTLPNNSGTFALLEAGQTFTADILVPDEAYDASGWNGSFEVPTKNAIRDKIESMSASSGITRTIVSTSGSATMGSSASTDYVYFVTGAHTMSLPAAAGNTNRYTVKNNHSANITIDTAGAETVEGAASISIAPQESVDILSNGTNWFVI